MGDSDLSASELRYRYHKGGSVPDDELTSAQLRARHAIPSNSKGTEFCNNLLIAQFYASEYL
jgi:hypothetical protein